MSAITLSDLSRFSRLGDLIGNRKHTFGEGNKRRHGQYQIDTVSIVPVSHADSNKAVSAILISVSADKSGGVDVHVGHDGLISAEGKDYHHSLLRNAPQTS
jgi:hypothetical protein